MRILIPTTDTLSFLKAGDSHHKRPRQREVIDTLLIQTWCASNVFPWFNFVCMIWVLLQHAVHRIQMALHTWLIAYPIQQAFLFTLQIRISSKFLDVDCCIEMFILNIIWAQMYKLICNLHCLLYELDVAIKTSKTRGK